MTGLRRLRWCFFNVDCARCVCDFVCHLFFLILLLCLLLFSFSCCVSSSLSSSFPFFLSLSLPVISSPSHLDHNMGLPPEARQCPCWGLLVIIEDQHYSAGPSLASCEPPPLPSVACAIKSSVSLVATGGSNDHEYDAITCVTSGVHPDQMRTVPANLNLAGAMTRHIFQKRRSGSSPCPSIGSDTHIAEGCSSQDQAR